MGAAWQHVLTFSHEGHAVTVERCTDLGTAPAMHRAGTELDGVRVWRYRPGREDALCDLLNLLSEIAYVTAVEGPDDDDGEGEDDDVDDRP